jgi:hypothetical protein
MMLINAFDRFVVVVVVVVVVVSFTRMFCWLWVFHCSVVAIFLITEKKNYNLYHTPSFLSSVQLARAQKCILNPPYHAMACRFCSILLARPSPRYRILAHAFFHHATVFRAHEAETGLCGRFVRFCLAFGLIPLNLLIVPLEEIGISEEEQRKLTLQQ